MYLLEPARVQGVGPPEVVLRPLRLPVEEVRLGYWFRV
jgi:hypothetical protein